MRTIMLIHFLCKLIVSKFIIIENFDWLRSLDVTVDGEIVPLERRPLSPKLSIERKKLLSIKKQQESLIKRKMNSEDEELMNSKSVFGSGGDSSSDGENSHEYSKFFTKLNQNNGILIITYSFLQYIEKKMKMNSLILFQRDRRWKKRFQ